MTALSKLVGQTVLGIVSRVYTSDNLGIRLDVSFHPSLGSYRSHLTGPAVAFYFGPGDRRSIDSWSDAPNLDLPRYEVSTNISGILMHLRNKLGHLWVAPENWDEVESPGEWLLQSLTNFASVQIESERKEATTDLHLVCNHCGEVTYGVEVDDRCNAAAYMFDDLPSRCQGRYWPKDVNGLTANYLHTWYEPENDRRGRDWTQMKHIASLRLTDHVDGHRSAALGLQEGELQFKVLALPHQMQRELVAHLLNRNLDPDLMDGLQSWTRCCLDNFPDPVGLEEAIVSARKKMVETMLLPPNPTFGFQIYPKTPEGYVKCGKYTWPAIPPHNFEVTERREGDTSDIYSRRCADRWHRNDLGKGVAMMCSWLRRVVVYRPSNMHHRDGDPDFTKRYGTADVEDIHKAMMGGPQRSDGYFHDGELPDAGEGVVFSREYKSQKHVADITFEVGAPWPDTYSELKKTMDDWKERFLDSLAIPKGVLGLLGSGALSAYPTAQRMQGEPDDE